MARENLSSQSLESLCETLGAETPGSVADFAEIRRAEIVPKNLGFGPELVIQSGERYYLIHELATDELPSWVSHAALQLSTSRNTNIMALARLSPGDDPRYIASRVIDACSDSAVGLCLETSSKIALVLPPGYKPLTGPSDQEFGHIPSWVLERIERCSSFSDYLRERLQRFINKYREITKNNEPSNVIEARLLHRLAESLADADERLFFPTQLIHALQAYEQSRANTRARDHFFHTFNNLLLGFVILGGLFGARTNNDRPDRFLRPARISKTKFWETLWAMTALFHDPGYLAEDPMATLRFTLGLEYDARRDEFEIPEPMKRVIQQAWEVDYWAARTDLLDLFKRTCGHWSPESCGADVARNFDAGLQRAFFDGKAVSHSVISGLTIIQQCRNDKTVKSPNYDFTKALTACEIAGLCMLFHDQRCRDKLELAGLPPIGFEDLPYASTLMFVDCLQDDRRDISTATFPKHGVLSSLKVDPDESLVEGTVDLRQTSLNRWPYLIAEFENATHWINRESKTKFLIDYQSTAGIELPRD